MTPTAHALLVSTLVLLAAAPAGAQDPSRLFNEELQDVWDTLRPAAEAELRRQAALKVGALSREPKVEVDLKAIRSISLDLGRAPGLTRFSDQGLAVRVPIQGAWRVEVDGDLEVRYKLLGKWRTTKLRVQVEVKDLTVSTDAAFDWSDPTRPKIARVGTPDTFFRVRVRSPGNLFADVLLRALSPLGSVVGRIAAARALDALAPQLRAFTSKLPGAIHAEGAPLLTASGSTTPVTAIVAGVDKKIRDLHLPNGIIHPLRMSLPATETWAQAYGPNGTGNPGTASIHGDGGDSSAMNGHYVAAQACRWALTSDPDALDNVKRCIVAYQDMLALHGDTGLMARVAAPEASEMGQIILRHNSARSIYRGVRRGVPWVATNGDKGDSRDVYIEIVYGLTVVHDLVSQPQVRADVAKIITSMVGYLVRCRWIITEDRAPADFSNPAGSTFPSFWLGVPTQKLAMLLIAARLDPGRFGGELARWSPLSKMAWLSQWTGTFSLDDYFGAVLAYCTYYTHLRHETDPARFMDMGRAYRILHRAVGHHRNAYFDALHLALDPSAVAYRGAVEEELVRYVQRPHRKVAPAMFDPTKITYVNVTFPVNGYGPGGTATTTVRLPAEPLSPEQRNGEDDTIWQRSPFSPYQGPGAGDPYIESTGLDLVGPYWMGRYHGVTFP